MNNDLKTFDIASLGELLIDFTFQGISPNGQRLFAQNPGGAPANVLVSAQRLGARCAFLGKVGNDMHGCFLKQTLEQEKIDTKGLILDNKYFTTLAFVNINENGERSFITVNGIEANHKKEWFDNLNMNQYENIYLAGYQLCGDNSDIIVDWLLKQSDKNIFFALGPVINNISKNTLEKIFSINPILHLNEKEALEFTKKNNINDSILKLYELTKSVVFITVGERGVIFYDGKNITHIEGEKVKVVDTIGAGDSHIGTIISAYSLWADKINFNYSWSNYLNENNDFIKGCKLSNKVASEVVQVQGAKISKECFNKFNI